MMKAIVLLSGGLDSTTCLAYAKSQGFDCHALSFNYGQRHHSELEAAKRIAKQYQATHHIFNIDISQFGGSALTNDQMIIPDHDPNKNTIPVTYVPARNTIFLSIALAQAEVVNAQAIFTGVSARDYSGYPDCRPAHIEAFQAMSNLATKAAVEDKQFITIHTPLIHLSKAETVKLGLSLGVDYSLTVSCYQANEQGQACGRCDSCTYRKKGFSDLGVKDPTHYQ